MRARAQKRRRPWASGSESGDHETEEAQHAQALAGPITKGLSNIGGASHAQQGKDEVAQAGHHLSSCSFADLAAILIQGDIPDPVAAIFNRPMITVQGEQAGRAGLFRSQAGQAIDGFSAEFARNDFGDVALDAEDLGRIREGEIAGQFGAGPDLAGFQPAVGFIGGGVLRGGTLSGSGLRCPGAAWVDCL